MKQEQKKMYSDSGRLSGRLQKDEPLMSEAEYVDTVVIGGGQAGLSVGYYLRQYGQPFVILEGTGRIGDSWRKRWDSLRLFTPARYAGLAGMPFPAPPHYFPTKDEMAGYLEDYATHFALPVRTGVKVSSVSRYGDRFLVKAGNVRFMAENVVVAMATYQKPRIPAFARELAPGIRQIHSRDYRSPSQLQKGGVLIVGAGNSGAEIAMEVSRTHHTWVSGRDTGHIPFRINGWAARLFLVTFVLRVLFHRVLTIDTPVGRKVRPRIVSMGGPLIRVMPKDMRSAGIQRTPKMAGVENGKPVMEDRRVLDVANVIWCTGFHSDFSWIDFPIFREYEPMQERGIVSSVPGLYFVGLHFQYALSSTMIHGVSRDAKYIVDTIRALAKTE